MQVNNPLTINPQHHLPSQGNKKQEESKPSLFEKIHSVCCVIKKYKFPIFSSFYCYNYTQGHFDSLYYGKTHLDNIKDFFFLVDTPVFLKDMSQIKKVFNEEKKFLVALKLTGAVSKTLKYVTKIYHLSSELLAKISKVSLPYLNQLKTVSDVTGKVTTVFTAFNFARISHDKIKEMIKDPSKRTLLNGMKTTMFTALSFFLLGITFKVSVITKVPCIALNISTLSVFVIQQAELLSNSSLFKRNLQKVTA